MDASAFFNSLDVPALSYSVPYDTGDAVSGNHGVNGGDIHVALSHGCDGGGLLANQYPFHVNQPYHPPQASAAIFEPQPSLPGLQHDALHFDYPRGQAFADTFSLCDGEFDNTHRAMFPAPMPGPQAYHSPVPTFIPHFAHRPFFGGQNMLQQKQTPQLHSGFANAGAASHEPPTYQLPTPAPSHPATPPLSDALGPYIASASDDRNVQVSDGPTGFTQGDAQEPILGRLDPSMFPAILIDAQLANYHVSPVNTEMTAFMNTTNLMEQHVYHHSHTSPHSTVQQGSSSSSSTVRVQKSKNTKRRKPYRRIRRNSSTVTAAQPANTGSTSFVPISEDQPAIPSFPGECLIPGCTVSAGDDDSAEALRMRTRAGFRDHLHRVHFLTRSKNGKRPTMCLWPGCQVEVQSGSAARHIMALHGPREADMSAAIMAPIHNTEPEN